MKKYSANLIADFMRAKNDPDVGDIISNLKLQKLLYYAAGLIAAVRQNPDAPLFGDSIEAWTHGPVVPSQYRRFSNRGADALPVVEEFDFAKIDAHDLEVLDDVYNYYGQYSAWKLRNMTHEEAPWLSSHERQDNRISQKQLADFFSDEVSDEYIEAYQEKAGQSQPVQ